jgi:hypothetical protein
LVGKVAARRQRICGPPHAGSARRQRSPVAARIDAWGLAAWGHECSIEIKHRPDPALALEQLGQCLLTCATAPADISVLDEQVLALP